MDFLNEISETLLGSDASASSFAPTAAPTVAINPGVGYIAALIAVLGFGSNFIPAKKVDTGDGLYFQWVMCCGIWLSSVVVQFALGNPQFEPFAMLGGWLWCSGNVMSLLAINYIGMGLGLLLWGSTNMLLGWASGTFGFFGIEKSDISNVALNYAGVAVAVIALFMYMFVETESTDKPAEDSGSLNSNLLDDEGDAPYANKSNDLEGGVDANGRSVSTAAKEAGASKKLLGITMALVAGVFFGFNFDPVEMLKRTKSDDGEEAAPGWTSNTQDHSPDSIDYVFSHFSGIFLTSSVYFIMYLVYHHFQGTTPYIKPELTLPAFMSGFGWAIADIAWFVGNDNLSLAVAFPVITSGPGLVGAMWGVFLFGEIKGTANLRKLLFACTTTVIAVTMIALSR
uniref:Transmembrane protein 144 n=1 Tax=Florenciella parvula TaxID=236787 RepID=A0A7S2CIC8_9STRA|mmetsp:Transcript_29476/g.60365  ORF Transcript_29476/g.60365 Transcript_29476/m.60365 type:complete len:398 (+) Transcript_29476:86-1279(+)